MFDVKKLKDKMNNGKGIPEIPDLKELQEFKTDMGTYYGSVVEPDNTGGELVRALDVLGYVHWLHIWDGVVMADVVTGYVDNHYNYIIKHISASRKYVPWMNNRTATTMLL